MSGAAQETRGSKDGHKFWKKFNCQCSNKNRHLVPQTMIVQPSHGLEMEDVSGPTGSRNVSRAHRLCLPMFRLPRCLRPASDSSVSLGYYHNSLDSLDSLSSLERERLNATYQNQGKPSSNSQIFRQLPNEGVFTGIQQKESTPKSARMSDPRSPDPQGQCQGRQGLDDFQASPIPAAQREKHFFAFPPYRPEDLIQSRGQTKGKSRTFT